MIVMRVRQINMSQAVRIIVTMIIGIFVEQALIDKDCKQIWADREPETAKVTAVMQVARKAGSEALLTMVHPLYRIGASTSKSRTSRKRTAAPKTATTTTTTSRIWQPRRRAER